MPEASTLIAKARDLNLKAACFADQAARVKLQTPGLVVETNQLKHMGRALS